MKFLAAAATILGLLCTVPAFAEQSGDDAAARLSDKLDVDTVDPAIVPKGYNVLIVEPFAIADSDEDQQVKGAIHILLERDNHGKEGEGTRETIYYFVFPSAQFAEKFSSGWDDTISLFEAQFSQDEDKAKINKEGSKTERQFETSVAASKLELQCRALDFLIDCRWRQLDAGVVIDVVLQEPKLRSAANDQERQRVLDARVRQEANGLFKTAQMHLVRAMQAR